MIIFGAKEKHIATFKIDTKCRNCGNKDTIYMNIYQKYAHVIWIPFFPMSKRANTECSHCKNITEKENFSNNMYHVYLKLKKKAKTPLWLYSGLASLLIVVSVGLTNKFLDSRKSVKFILAPQVGDVYQMKIDEKAYSLAKVHHVKGDTTYLQLFQYSTDKSSDIDNLKAKGTSAFQSKTVSVVTSELKVMLDEGKIMAVER